MIRRILILTAAAALLTAGAAHAYTKYAGLVVSDLWSRPAAQGGNGAGFLTVENKGSTPDKLIAVSSPIASRVEIHESMIMDGKAMMHPRPGGATVPANGTLQLKPGGWHLMFIGLKRPLKAGDTFPATLTFQKAGKKEWTFTVRSGAATPAAATPEHKH